MSFFLMIINNTSKKKTMNKNQISLKQNFILFHKVTFMINVTRTVTKEK